MYLPVSPPSSMALALSTLHSSTLYLSNPCLHASQRSFAAVVKDAPYWIGLGYEAWDKYTNKDDTTRQLYGRRATWVQMCLSPAYKVSYDIWLTCTSAQCEICAKEEVQMCACSYDCMHGCRSMLLWLWVIDVHPVPVADPDFLAWEEPVHFYQCF